MSVNTGLQPVGNQVQGEAQTATQAAVRQAQQSVQITDYTYVYETNGVGVVEFKAMFDVSFTQEPVMHHGMSLPDFAATVSGAAGSDTTKSIEQLRQALRDAQTAYAPYADGQALNQDLPTTTLVGQLAAAVRTAQKALDAALGLGQDSTAYPLVSAYVKRWLVDSTGLYVGADMILVIGVLSLPAAVAPPVIVPPPPNEEPAS